MWIVIAVGLMTFSLWVTPVSAQTDCESDTSECATTVHCDGGDSGDGGDAVVKRPFKKKHHLLH